MFLYSHLSLVLKAKGLEMRNKARTSIKFIAIVCLFAVFSSALFLFSDSFALNLTDQVILVRGNMSYNFASPANLSDCNFSNYNSYLGNPNSNLTCYIRSITLELPSEQYASSDYLYVPLYVFNNANNNGSDAFLSNLSTSTSGFDLVSVEFNQLSSSSGLANLIFKVYTPGNYSTLVLTSTTGNAFSTLHEGEYLASGKSTHYRPIGQVDTQSIVNAINNQSDYTQSLNNIRNDIQGLSDAQEQANHDANERYQDEKILFRIIWTRLKILLIVLTLLFLFLTLLLLLQKSLGNRIVQRFLTYRAGLNGMVLVRFVLLGHLL